MGSMTAYSSGGNDDFEEPEVHEDSIAVNLAKQALENNRLGRSKPAGKNGPS